MALVCKLDVVTHCRDTCVGQPLLATGKLLLLEGWGSYTEPITARNLPGDSMSILWGNN